MVKKLFQYIGFFFLLCLSLGGHAATTPESQFKEARQVYDKGDFAQAISLYQGLIQEGIHSGYLYYNLGNSYYRTQAWGEAKAAYLAARSELPRNGDIQANLTLVHQKSTDHLQFSRTPSPFFFWRSWGTASEFSLLTALLAGLALLLCSLGLCIPRLHTLRTLGRFGLVGAALVGAAAGKLMQSKEIWGAVISKETAVHSAPGAHNLSLFTLHEGAPLIWLQTEGDWSQILLVEEKDVRRGWVTTNAIRVYR